MPLLFYGWYLTNNSNSITKSLLCATQLQEEQAIKNASIWAMKEYYANYSLLVNGTEVTPPPMDPADVIRGPCWETAVGIVIKIKQIHVLM